MLNKPNSGRWLDVWRIVFKYTWGPRLSYLDSLRKAITPMQLSCLVIKPIDYKSSCWTFILVHCDTGLLLIVVNHTA